MNKVLAGFLEMHLESVFIFQFKKETGKLFFKRSF